MKKLSTYTAPVAQGELFEIDAGWFHVFHDFVRTQMGNMTESELKVFLVIRSHTNPTNGNSFPGVELIADIAHISERQVKRALASLEAAGHITKRKDGRHNVYQMFDQWPVRDAARNEVNRFEIAPYIPSLVQRITDQLKTALANGSLPVSGPINLNLNMPVTINYADNGSTVINNTGDAVEIKIDQREAERVADTLPDNLRAPLIAVKPKKQPV